MGADAGWAAVLAAAVVVAAVSLGPPQHAFAEASSAPFNLTMAGNVTRDHGFFPVGNGVGDIATFESAGHAYAAVTFEGVMQVLNLTDPHNIVLAGSIGGLEGREVRDGIKISTFESAGRPYAAVVSGLDVRVLNLTDPHNIVPVYGIDHDFGPGAIYQPGIATFESAGRTYAIVSVFLGDRVCIPEPFNPPCDHPDVDETTILQVLDLTDPQNIFPTVRIVHDGLHPYHSRQIAAFESAGRTYAIAPAHDGVHVLNLTDPARIVSTGHTTDNDNLFLQYAGLATAFESDDRPYAAISTYSGMKVLNLTDPQNIVLAGSIAGGDGYWLTVDQLTDAIDAGLPVIFHGGGFWLNGGGFRLNGADNIAAFESGGRSYAAVSTYTNIQVLDLTYPYNMVLVGSLDYDVSSSYARSIATFESGGHIYAVVGLVEYVQVIQLTTNVT